MGVSGGDGRNGDTRCARDGPHHAGLTCALHLHAFLYARGRLVSCAGRAFLLGGAENNISSRTLMRGINLVERERGDGPVIEVMAIIVACRRGVIAMAQFLLGGDMASAASS